MMKKRLFAGFLSLCLLAGLFPTAALAAENGKAAESAPTCTCTALCGEQAPDESCAACAEGSAPCAFTPPPVETARGNTGAPSATNEMGARNITQEEALREAIQNSNGTKENPAVIQISGPITLTSTIQIPDGKYIELIGTGEGTTISPAENFSSGIFATALIEVGSTETAEALLTLRNITLDGGQKTRGIAIHRAQYLNLENVTIKNGYTGSAASGGGLIVSWTAGGQGPYVSISDSEIYNCQAGLKTDGKGKYGGAINMYGTGALTLNNVNFHDNFASWAGSSIYSASMQISGLVNIGENEGGQPGVYGGKIRVAAPLSEGSNIVVSGIIGNDPKSVFNITGTDSYPLTQSDFEKFSLGTIMKNSVDISAGYMLCLDESANSIELAEAVQITLYANTGGPEESIQYRAPKNTESMLPTDAFAREGYLFAGWNTMPDGSGTGYTGPTVTLAQDTDLYAQWVKLEANDIQLEYGASAPLPAIPGVTLTNWKSADETVVQVDGDRLNAAGHGETTLTATAQTNAGDTAELTVRVKVTPIFMIYGQPNTGSGAGQPTPLIEYPQPKDGVAPELSEHLWFYRAVRQQDGSYQADPSQRLELRQGADIKFRYTQNGSVLEAVDSLPFLTNDGAAPIDVTVLLQNPNYQVVMADGSQPPSGSFGLQVNVQAAGLDRVPLVDKDTNQDLPDNLQPIKLEYTGTDGPAIDLTALEAGDISTFTVHFHSITEGISYDEHLSGVPSQLTEAALRAIMPKNAGVYSMVITGQGQTTYAYSSCRFEIVKGSPVGGPSFQQASSGVPLASVALTGTMKNAAGLDVPGTFAWEDPNQTVANGQSYKWVFTPDDPANYNAASGQAVVWPKADPAPGPDPTPAPTQAPAPSPTQAPTPKPSAKPTPTASPSPEATAAPSATPGSTATAAPGPTATAPAPTATPAPDAGTAGDPPASGNSLVLWLALAALLCAIVAILVFLFKRRPAEH